MFINVHCPFSNKCINKHKHYHAKYYSIEVLECECIRACDCFFSDWILWSRLSSFRLQAHTHIHTHTHTHTDTHKVRAASVCCLLSGIFRLPSQAWQRWAGAWARNMGAWWAERVSQQNTKRSEKMKHNFGVYVITWLGVWVNNDWGWELLFPGKKEYFFKRLFSEDWRLVLGDIGNLIQILPSEKHFTLNSTKWFVCLFPSLWWTTFNKSWVNLCAGLLFSNSEKEWVHYPENHRMA